MTEPVFVPAAVFPGGVLRAKSKKWSAYPATITISPVPGSDSQAIIDTVTGALQAQPSIPPNVVEAIRILIGSEILNQINKVVEIVIPEQYQEHVPAIIEALKTLAGG